MRTTVKSTCVFSEKTSYLDVRAIICELEPECNNQYAIFGNPGFELTYAPYCIYYDR